MMENVNTNNSFNDILFNSIYDFELTNVLNNSIRSREEKKHLFNTYNEELANNLYNKLVEEEAFLDVIEENDKMSYQKKQELKQYYINKLKQEKKIPATEKQINLIMKLDPKNDCLKDLSKLYKKLASKIITKLLKQTKNNNTGKEENIKEESIINAAACQDIEIIETSNTPEQPKLTLLEENDQFYIRGVAFGIGKENTIKEVLEDIEEIKKRENYDLTQKVFCCQGYLDFNSEESYNNFVKCLLKDQEVFLNNRIGGGCWVNLETLEEMPEQDYYKIAAMKPEQRKAEKIGSCTFGVVARVNGKDKIAIDPEGYSYCRYVGILPEKEVIYKAPETSAWLTEQEKREIEKCKKMESGEEFSLYDFGALRSENKYYWEELKKLGNVKIDKLYWSFKRF